MRAPAFWSRPPACRPPCCPPFPCVYARATARRVAREATIRPPVPVICVGNLSAGGTGKTPTVIALVELLRGLGVEPVVLSRGYGGRLPGPVLVDPARHSAEEVGDEPLLLSAFARVVVGRDRGAAASLAVQTDAGALILDDGFQNPAVAKDLSLVVVDAETGFGNGRVLPAGPLREPVQAGLARADIVLSIGGDEAQRGFTLPLLPYPPPMRLNARLEPLPTGMDWRDMPVLAFAGIGRPAKFFATLDALGARLVRKVALGDHQALAPALLARLERDAAALGAQLVTTEKDAVRLPQGFRGKVLTLPVRLTFDDVAPLRDRLAALVAQG